MIQFNAKVIFHDMYFAQTKDDVIEMIKEEYNIDEDTEDYEIEIEDTKDLPKTPFISDIQEQIKESVKAESNDSPKAKSNDFAKEPKGDSQ